ncbi:hypothetical protein JAAARDRAFT_188016 [Jaapia argillacea MUCL 33604]|uniref:Protein YTP1-like C-terminal domain-containing protein n=1 Tax=Jaapia argillacea MUCL 33604 TaxID=933084 RepID=A0A067QCC0_9AGAM|nr:hypothetical protein JAAARDRAFT_188016 [Jaapia argillacea MUCL 33604]
MRSSSLGLLIPALGLGLLACLSSVDAAPPSIPFSDLTTEDIHPLLRRDEHGHGHDHHAAPKMELNETEIFMYHSPTPPSYWSIDFEEPNSGDHWYPGFMGLHIFFMSSAFFGVLPAGIALRSVNHSWHGFTVILFWILVVLGCASSGLYRKLTPNMYEGQKHSIQGYFFLLLAISLSAVDFAALGVRLFTYVKNVRRSLEKFSARKAWRYVILGQEDALSSRQSSGEAEYSGLIVDDPEEYDMEDMQKDQHGSDSTNEIRGHRHTQSTSSERTVFDSHSPSGSRYSDDTLSEFPGLFVKEVPRPLLTRIGHGVFATLERALVFAGFVQVLSGIVVYTGGCRESFINNCLAHLIKGGIFWCYGLVTFARYLGSFSELGWAWNRPPRNEGKYPTAEFVESLVIFLYGVTNTWMERFGAKPGDPYSTKQVQHIGIAVMFWFAGLVGMGLESRRVRRWLAAASTASLVNGASVTNGKKSQQFREAVAEPPSYSASFNPFPALVIGVTGLAMSAHYQEYLFQVQIHQLWGWLLAGFSVLRFLTYFFLWVAPPRSILPSRPPTEALSSFFLACGGLTFIFSTEEVTYAAMRRGRDDMMMFMNVAVAITCFCFCWAMAIVAFKGWLKSRTHVAVKFHNST